MKRVKFLKFLRKNSCYLLREGGSHSWFKNEKNGRRSAVPRHSEINDILVIKICKDLGIKFKK